MGKNKKGQKGQKGIRFPLDNLEGQEQALQQAKTEAEAKAKEKAADVKAKVVEAKAKEKAAGETIPTEDSTGSLAATSALLDDAISGHIIAMRKEEQAAAAVKKAAAEVFEILEVASDEEYQNYLMNIIIEVWYTRFSRCQLPADYCDMDILTKCRNFVSNVRTNIMMDTHILGAPRPELSMSPWVVAINRIPGGNIIRLLQKCGISRSSRVNSDSIYFESGADFFENIDNLEWFKTRGYDKKSYPMIKRLFTNIRRL